MIYMINSFEFQETNFSSSLKANYKLKIRKLEKTVPLIRIASDKLKASGRCLHGNNIPLHILTTRVK